MTKLGSIRHSDPNTQTRVTLYSVPNDPHVWAAAAGDEPCRTDTPIASAARGAMCGICR